jgi:hypothetical protein
VASSTTGEADVWKNVGRATCWIELDFSTPGRRYWNMNHYPV